ncbi:hypothetical protein Tco_0395076, partial [Tanacetum coccineum]
EHSTVTYTSISSDDGSLDVGSPRVIVLGYDGLPMMPDDPYAYVEATMQEPPSSDFILEHAYLEFMPPESDLKEDPEEDDKDPEEDPADYLADRDDDDDDEEESSRDDVHDDKEEEDEEEHLALADSVPPPAYGTTVRMSIRAQTPIPFPSEAEVDRLLG